MNDFKESAGRSEQNSNMLKVVIAGAIALVVLVAFFVFTGDDDNPKPWLDENYSHVSGSDPDDETVVYRSDESTTNTFNAIVRGTDPDDRYDASISAAGSGNSASYLRYDADWIVTVQEDGNEGSRITLDEYDRAYNQHSTILPVVWGNFHGRSGGGGGFRGGGSGFGK